MIIKIKQEDHKKNKMNTNKSDLFFYIYSLLEKLPKRNQVKG
jgi:hypothetical protein